MCICSDTGVKSEATSRAIAIPGSHPLPPRPGHGTRGRKIPLWTNFFKVTIPANLTLFHYDVVIHPIVPRAIKRRVMQAAVQKYGEKFSGQSPVFDGEKNLYCHKRLSNNEARMRMCLSMCMYIHVHVHVRGALLRGHVNEAP